MTIESKPDPQGDDRTQPSSSPGEIEAGNNKEPGRRDQPEPIELPGRSDDPHEPEDDEEIRLPPPDRQRRPKRS
jgi:hypothetical protein